MVFMNCGTKRLRKPKGVRCIESRSVSEPLCAFLAKRHRVIVTHPAVVEKDDQRFQSPSPSSATEDFVTFLWPLEEEKVRHQSSAVVSTMIQQRRAPSPPASRFGIR